MPDLIDIRAALVKAGFVTEAGEKVPRFHPTKAHVTRLRALLQETGTTSTGSNGEAIYLLWNGLTKLPDCSCGSGRPVTFPTMKACSVSCARTKALDVEAWRPTAEEAVLPLEELLQRFGLDQPSNGTSTIQRQVLAFLCERAGIKGSYPPRLLVQLLRDASTSFKTCPCGSGREVIPEHGTERFCSSTCSAANAFRIAQAGRSYERKTGFTNPWSNPDVTKKLREKTIERYGVQCFPKRLIHIREAIGVELLDTKWQGFRHSYRWRCQKGHEYEKAIPDGMLPVCRTCHPTSSGPQRELHSWLESLGEKVTANDRVIIKPYELDLVLPAHKLAIELNGVYFHDDRAKESGYHRMKADLAEKAGIQLVQVTDAEWVGSNELVKDRLLALLGRISAKVYARSCDLVDVETPEARAFCEVNHLQGWASASTRLGLKYRGELVALMTFTKPRFNKRHAHELVRFCTKVGLKVPGGASRLLKAARSRLADSIVSYADRRYSTGKLYRALGFTLEGTSPPNYWWVNLKGEVYPRYATQKHRLSKLLPKFDASLSERDNMHANGYWCIEDAGHLVFSIS